MERQKVTSPAVRQALQALGAGGKEVSYALLYDALGLTKEQEKDIVRARIGDMARQGEVTRTERGSFVYNAKYRARKGAGYESIWRYVRAAKPGWTLGDCSLMTRQSYSHVMRYIGWLVGERFVARAGQDDKRAITYRNTEKARSTPETPYPPIKESDPFAKERIAAATITRLMLCANPYALKTSREIADACRLLLTRFGKNVTENRTKNENEEDCHVE